jgi:hypothetical protein
MIYEFETQLVSLCKILNCYLKIEKTRTIIDIKVPSRKSIQQAKSPSDKLGEAFAEI